MSQRDIVKAQIVRRLTPKYAGELDWPMLVASVQAASPQEKADILGSLRRSSFRQTGVKLKNLVNRRAAILAESEADTILSDDSLSLAEIVRIYG